METTNLFLLKKMKPLFEAGLYNLLTSKENIKLKLIHSPGPYQAGLELVGILPDNQLRKTVILWGSRESHYFDIVSPEMVKVSIARVFELDPPIVILSIGMDPKWVGEIVEIANLHEVPIVQSRMHAREINADIYQSLAPTFAPSTTLHASAVVINDVGVLIMGEPGIGKSETIIDLISRGHSFVGDDSIEVKRLGSSFTMESNPITKNFIEARGIGIMDATKIFGNRSFVESNEVNLVIKLINWDSQNHSGDNFQRIGREFSKFDILDFYLPYLEIPVSSGRNIATLVELATNVFSLKRKNDYVEPADTMRGRLD